MTVSVPPAWHVMLTGITEPLMVPRLTPLQPVPAVALVLVEVGAVHPLGTVIVASEPDAKRLLGAVKLNVRVSPVLPAPTLVGETVIVPDPLAAVGARISAT